MFRHAKSSREKDALCSCSGYMTEAPNEVLKMGSLLVIAYKSRRLMADSSECQITSKYTFLHSDSPQ